MSPRADMLPRLLLVGDPGHWPAAWQAELSMLPVTARVAELDEAFVWLESQGSGVTIIQVEDGTALEPMLARLEELHPTEVILLVMDAPEARSYRQAMRGGAYDLLDRSTDAKTFMQVLEAAATRHARVRAVRRRESQVAEERVRRHEREAASRMVEGVPMAGAWAELDVTVRRRWLSRYLHAAHGQDPAARQGFLSEVAAELESRSHAGEILLSLHIHALIGDRAARAAGAERARDLLIELLVKVLDRRAPTGVVLPGDEEATGSAAWHRWTWDGREHWWLVREGRVDAFLVIEDGETRGVWARGADLVAGSLPSVPAALRQVERDVGSGYVLDVVSRAA